MIFTFFFGQCAYEVHTTSQGQLLFIQARPLAASVEHVVDINELPVVLQDKIYQRIYQEMRRK